MWTPAQFRKRHAKHLSPAQGKKAASIANAMLRGGADEGMAIATAIKHAKAGKARPTSTVLSP